HILLGSPHTKPCILLTLRQDYLQSDSLSPFSLTPSSNEPELMIKLAECLFYLGWQKHGLNPTTKEGSPYQYDDAERNKENIYWQESLQVYDKLLHLNVATKYREAAHHNMLFMYKYRGEYEKSKALANEQPCLYNCKEVLLTYATTGEEEAQYAGELILALLSLLYGTMSRSVLTNSDLASSEYGREVLLALIRMIETVFPDGRCGRMHWDLRYLYLLLAMQESRHGDREKALTCFEKGFDHHKEYCRISTSPNAYSYTSPLVAKVSLAAGQFQENPENFWAITMPQFSEEFQKELEKNEKFKECFE
ncbi:MAG: hypothetical protein IJ427_13720, partial [Lachnospiraceae bacterium]|nr:hypothetical protein [Lachnospiraceae bacterium]